MTGVRRLVVETIMAAFVLAPAAAGADATLAAPVVNTASYRDGHTRPRALAFNPDDGLLYVALSTSDEIAVVDPAASPPRVLARKKACGFPDAIAAMPGGGAIVACRFDPGLRRVRPAGRGDWRVTALAAGSVGGARGLVVAPDGAVAYVASPGVGGIQVVSLAGRGGVVQTLATGVSPRALRIVPAGTLPRQDVPLLLVSNFIDHTVTVHAVGAEGGWATRARRSAPRRRCWTSSSRARRRRCCCSRTRTGRSTARTCPWRGWTAASSFCAPAPVSPGRGVVRRSGAREAHVHQPRRAGRSRDRARERRERRCIDDRGRGRGDRQPADRDGRRFEGRGRPSRWARILRPSRRCRAGAS